MCLLFNWVNKKKENNTESLRSGVYYWIRKYAMTKQILNLAKSNFANNELWIK